MLQLLQRPAGGELEHPVALSVFAHGNSSLCSTVALSVFAQLKSMFELASQSESHRQLINTPSTISVMSSSSSPSSTTSSSSSSTSSLSGYSLSLSPTSSNSAHAASSSMDNSDGDNDNNAGDAKFSKRRKVSGSTVFQLKPRRVCNSLRVQFSIIFLRQYFTSKFKGTLKRTTATCRNSTVRPYNKQVYH